MAGPIREQLRQTRREQLAALAQELTQLQARLGQPYCRTLKMVQRKANARCKASKVGHLMRVTVYETDAGVVNLHWQIEAAALHRAEEQDGRYLLVTNDWSLSHQEMFRLYREKDGVEKRFTICKGDLKVSPICRDGSCLRRLTPVEPEVACILKLVAQALDDLIVSPMVSKQPLLPAASGGPPPPLLSMASLC